MKFVSVYCTLMEHIFDIKTLIALTKDGITYIEIYGLISLILVVAMFLNYIEIFSIKNCMICITVKEQIAEKQLGFDAGSFVFSESYYDLLQIMLTEMKKHEQVDVNVKSEL